VSFDVALAALPPEALQRCRDLAEVRHALYGVDHSTATGSGQLTGRALALRTEIRDLSKT